MQSVIKWQHKQYSTPVVSQRCAVHWLSHCAWLNNNRQNYFNYTVGKCFKCSS